MSGEPLQEDNPFFEAQWKFVNEVADLLREQKTTDIESPLLQGIRHALDKHQIQEIRGTLEQPQIPENEAQVKVGAVIEDIASLLFDGVYSCAFINDPVLLSSGYIIDKAVFNLLSAENLLSDTIIPSHPSSKVTKQVVDLFHAFLKTFTAEKNRELIPLPSWLAEHFSDKKPTPLQQAKKLKQKRAEAVKKKKQYPRTSIVSGLEAKENQYIKKVEAQEKKIIEEGMKGLIESLGKEIEALIATPKVSDNKQVKNAAVAGESLKEESTETEMISDQSNDSWQRFIGWLVFFFASGTLFILALSAFFPAAYQALIFFVSSNPIIVAAVLAAILIILVVFTMWHFFLNSLKNSSAVAIPSVQEVQEKNQEKPIPIRQFLTEIRRPSPNKVLAPFLESALYLLDARQQNIEKYTQLIIKSRLANHKGNQHRDTFLSQSIVWLKQQHFKKYVISDDDEKDRTATLKQKPQQRIAEIWRQKKYEAALENQAVLTPELNQTGNPYKNSLLQPIVKDSDDEEPDKIYAAFQAEYWGDNPDDDTDGSPVEQGYDSEGIVVELGDENDDGEQLIGSDEEDNLENNRPGIKVIFS